VGKPDSCEDCDWEKIIQNLESSDPETVEARSAALTPQQERKLQRLLAYIIQAGNPDYAAEWEALKPQLQSLGFDQEMLAGMRAALKVPQSLEQLTEGLDADVAAVALSKAVGIALLDREVNANEDQALSMLLEAMKHH
jgi:hypothetical protein